MIKDIFVDANIAKNFVNPADPEYIKLIIWLKTCNYNPNQDAYLVVSKKLLQEYYGTPGECNEAQNIYVIVAKLQAEGRLIIKKNRDISNFRKTHYTKHICGLLRCTNTDRNYHIPTVLLSNEFTRFYPFLPISSITSAITNTEPVAQTRSSGAALTSASSTAEATLSATTGVTPHFENSLARTAGSTARGW